MKKNTAAIRCTGPAWKNFHHLRKRPPARSFPCSSVGTPSGRSSVPFLPRLRLDSLNQPNLQELQEALPQYRLHWGGTLRRRIPLIMTLHISRTLERPGGVPTPERGNDPPRQATMKKNTAAIRCTGPAWKIPYHLRKRPPARSFPCSSVGTILRGRQPRKKHSCHSLQQPGVENSLSPSKTPASEIVPMLQRGNHPPRQATMKKTQLPFVAPDRRGKFPITFENARQRDRSHAPAWERRLDAPASHFSPGSASTA